MRRCKQPHLVMISIRSIFLYTIYQIRQIEELGCSFKLELTIYLLFFCLRLEAIVYSDTCCHRYERPPTITEDEHLRYPLQRENVGEHYNPYTMYPASGHSVVMQQPHASSRRTGSSYRNMPISSYYTFEGAERINR